MRNIPRFEDKRELDHWRLWIKRLGGVIEKLIGTNVESADSSIVTWNDFQGQMWPQQVAPVIAVESTADSVSETIGTLTNTIANTYLENGTWLIVNEAAAPAQGFLTEFTFTDLTKTSNIVTIIGYYTGGHNVVLEKYRVDTASWVAVTGAANDFPTATVNTKYIFNLGVVTNYFTAGGVMRLRVRHNANGNVAHKMYYDKITIAREVHVPMLEPIASTGIRALEFPGTDTVITALSGSIEIDHLYAQGTTVYPHIHWMPTTTTGGNVKLFYEYVWINAFGTVSTSTTLSVTVAAGTTAWVEKRTNFDEAGISGTGKTMAGRLFWRFYRDPNDAADTYPDSILVFDIQVHRAADSLGSHGVTTK